MSSGHDDSTSRRMSCSFPMRAQLYSSVEPSRQPGKNTKFQSDKATPGALNESLVLNDRLPRTTDLRGGRTRLIGITRDFRTIGCPDSITVRSPAYQTCVQIGVDIHPH
jgi:hypothetical protein